MKEKLTKLLLKKQDVMYKRALYLTKNTHDANDLLNDTNIKLLQMIDRETFFDNNSAGKYFTDAVNSVFIDKKRKQSIRPLEINTNTFQHTAQADVEITLQCLNQIMDAAKIPAQRRNIFYLYLSGENMYEYGRSTGMNTNTVRAHIFKIKKALQRNVHLFNHLKDDFDLIMNP